MIQRLMPVPPIAGRTDRMAGSAGRRARRHSEPAFDAAADVGPDIDFGEFLGRADEQTADDRTGDESKPPKTSTGNALSTTSDKRELDAQPSTPKETGNQRDGARERSRRWPRCGAVAARPPAPQTGRRRPRET